VRSWAVIDLTLLSALPQEFREEAEVLRRWGLVEAAEAAERAARRIEERIHRWLDEELPIAKAAEEAGLSASAAEKRLASGRWPNAGRRYRPRVRRRDLCGSTSQDARTESRDPSTDAEDLVDDVLSAYDDTTCDH